MSLYKRDLGKKGEHIAADYLIDNKFLILSCNFRSKFGEIDIIAQKDRTVYFIEVKTRSSPKKGLPYEAINKHKIHQLHTTAFYFLSKNDYKQYKYSIAVISILFDNKNQYHIQFFDSLTIL